MTDLNATQTVTHLCRTISDFAQYIRLESRRINKDPNYSGVTMAIRSNEMIFEDGSSKQTPLKILFQDLIGQPTWLDLLTITFKTVMRGDINIGDWVNLPEVMVTRTKDSYSALKDDTSFKGDFKITNVRHVGDSRQPDGDSWATVYQALLI